MYNHWRPSNNGLVHDLSTCRRTIIVKRPTSLQGLTYIVLKLLKKVNITSAFMDCWEWAWADYIVTLNNYIASSASDVSALLVCTALQPRITRRHCSKFSVVPCRYEHHKTAVYSPASQLASCWAAYSSTVSVDWIHLYHVSVHSPTCLHR